MSAPAHAFNGAIHGLRGIAAGLVLACHLADGFHRHFFPADPVLSAAMPAAIRVGTFGVELFFLISGYVIAASVRRHAFGPFLLRRLVRLYPLFAGVTLLYFALNAVTHYRPEALGIGPLVANLLFLDLFAGTPALSPNAWSLTYEANFYVMAALGVLVWTRYGAGLGLVAFGAVAILLVAAFPIALYFLAGWLVHDGAGRASSIARPRLEAALLVALAAAGTVQRTYPPFQVPPAAMTVLLGLAWAWFRLAIRPGSLLDSLGRLRALAWLGTVSYSLYLSHPYAYIVMREVLKRTGLAELGPGLGALVYAPLMLGATLALAAIVYRTLEAWPYRAVFGEAVFRDGRPGSPALAAAPAPMAIR